jgi:ketosteroid isomerase-like protein
MVRESIVAASGFALMLLAGCAQPAPQVDTAKEIAAIKAGEAQWNASIAARDVAGFMSHYADNVVMMNPGANAAVGAPAAQAGIADSFKDPNFSLQFQADRVEVSKAGDMAYTQGHFAVSQTDPATHQKVSETGSYVTVYQKQADGSWKAVADIASPGAPPAAPPKT